MSDGERRVRGKRCGHASKNALRWPVTCAVELGNASAPRSLASCRASEGDHGQVVTAMEELEVEFHGDAGLALDQRHGFGARRSAGPGGADLTTWHDSKTHDASIGSDGKETATDTCVHTQWDAQTRSETDDTSMTSYVFASGGGSVVTVNTRCWTDDQTATRCAHFDGSIDSTFTEDIYERTGRTVDDNTNGTTHSETVCVSTGHESRAETENSTGFTTYFLGDKTEGEDDRSEEHVRWQSGSQGQTRDMTCHSWGTVVRQEEVAVDGGTVSLDEDHHSEYNYEFEQWWTGYHRRSEDHNTCHTWLGQAGDVEVVYPLEMTPTRDEPGRAAGFSSFASTLSITTVTGMGEIAGRAMDDPNANGSVDGGEQPISGRNIYLDLNGNSSRDANEPQTTTGADGGYHFYGLSAGDYTVRQELPANWLATANTPAIHLAFGQISDNQDLLSVAAASIHGTVFKDTDRNGARNGVFTAEYRPENS